MPRPSRSAHCKALRPRPDPCFTGKVQWLARHEKEEWYNVLFLVKGLVCHRQGGQHARLFVSDSVLDFSFSPLWMLLFALLSFDEIQRGYIPPLPTWSLAYYQFSKGAMGLMPVRFLHPTFLSSSLTALNIFLAALPMHLTGFWACLCMRRWSRTWSSSRARGRWTSAWNAQRKKSLCACAA